MELVGILIKQSMEEVMGKQGGRFGQEKIVRSSAEVVSMGDRRGEELMEDMGRAGQDILKEGRVGLGGQSGEAWDWLVTRETPPLRDGQTATSGPDASRHTI